MTQAPNLRAMARAYRAGHEWDELDANVCERGADEIDSLRAERITRMQQNDRMAERIAQLEAAQENIGESRISPTPAAQDKCQAAGAMSQAQPVMYGAQALTTGAGRLTAGAGPAYRLLQRGIDTIQEDDEFLRDDAVTWQVDPQGIFVGMPYMSNVLLPARRAIEPSP